MWKGVSPYIFSVDEAKVSEVLEAVSALTAIDIPEQTFAGTGLDKNLIIVQVKGPGIDNTIMLGDSNENGDYYAKKADSDNIYLVASLVNDALDKQIRDLR